MPEPSHPDIIKNAGWIDRSRTAGWMLFMKERVPLPAYGLLAGGLAASGGAMPGAVWSIPSFLASFAGLLLFFVVLRLMDEYKDVEKDRVANPGRPLPRGVLALDRVRLAILYGMAGMLAYGVFMAALFGVPAGLMYLVVAGYLWLMFREFYAGDWLARRPVCYALSHQLILIPCCLFVALVADPALLGRPEPWYFALAVPGAFFSYEICRKLDPAAHPILATYLHHHGPTATFALVAAAMAVAAAGAAGLGLEFVLWPVQILVVLAALLIFWSPRRYRSVEAAASLALAVHAWGLPLGAWLTYTGMLP